jgi:threonine-phosphate decarboxylase
MKPRHGGEVWNFKAIPIDFSANINPLGHSKLAKKAIEKGKIEHYPSQDYFKLKAAIADYVEIGEENIVLGNGSVELIKEFCSAFLKEPDNTVILQPTFSEYERFSHIYCKEVKHVHAANGFNHTAEEILKAVDRATRIIFICRPNNPTGTAMQGEDVEEIIDFAQENDVFVFLDEVFIEFSELKSYAPMVDRCKNLFVLRSFTKFFALPGLRIGYGVGPTELVKELESLMPPWNINNFAHDAALASLQDRPYMERTKQLIDEEKTFLSQKLRELGIKVYESKANFLLLRYNWNSKQVKEELLKEGLLIRDCSNFPGLDTRFIRIGLRQSRENKKLLNALKKQVGQGMKTGKECKYYPCHFEGQDCTFCFCPFYPCGDESKGRLIVGGNGKCVWTCKDCDDIHRLEVVNKILEFLGEKKIEEVESKKRLEIKDAVM